MNLGDLLQYWDRKMIRWGGRGVEVAVVEAGPVGIQRNMYE